MTAAAAPLVLAALQIATRAFGRRTLTARLLDRLPGDGAGGFAKAALALWLAWGLPAVAALTLLGRGTGLPPELAPAAVVVRSWGVFRPGPVIVGLVLGSALSVLLARRRARRGKRPFHLGRPPRLPRDARERRAGVLLALSAGVAEELYFRLALPLLVAVVTGSAMAGVLVSATAFGIVHRYQGPVGMVATAGAGLFLSALYFSTGALWVAMLCHAAIDLNALVIRPRFARD